MSISLLNPNVGLEKQPLFWLAIVAPVLGAILLGFPVWVEYDLGFDLDAHNKFLKISKLPIGVASLAIPLGVLVGRLHGASQAAIQIENTRIQIKNTNVQIENARVQISISEQDNKTKLYLSHFDHFCSHIDFIESCLIDRFSSILIDDGKSIIDKLSMYRLLYPDNSLTGGINSLSKNFRESAKNRMDSLLNSYLNFSAIEGGFKVFESRLKQLEDTFIDVQLRFFCCQKSRGSIFIKDFPERLDGTYPFGVSKNLSDYFFQVEFFLELLDGVESFEIHDPEKRTGHPVLRGRNFKPNDSSDCMDNWSKWQDKYVKIKVYSQNGYGV